MKDWTYDPAHDLGLPAVQRWRSVRREPGLGEVIVQWAWWSGMQLYLSLLHRMQVEGRSHLPSSPPFVLIANHTSHLDAVACAAALPSRLRRCALPVAAGDTFFETPAVAAFAAVCLNALPLWRERVGRHALDHLRTRMLEEPCGLILFPEGTRSRTGNMGRFKPGLGMLVAGTPVPVVPCQITGAHDAWPPGRRAPRPFRPVAVRIGAALRFGDVPNTRDGWLQIAADAESAVQSLSPDPGSAVQSGHA